MRARWSAPPRARLPAGGRRADRKFAQRRDPARARAPSPCRPARITQPPRRRRAVGLPGRVRRAPAMESGSSSGWKRPTSRREARRSQGPLRRPARSCPARAAATALSTARQVLAGQARPGWRKTSVRATGPWTCVTARLAAGVCNVLERRTASSPLASLTMRRRVAACPCPRSRRRGGRRSGSAS